MLSRIYDYWRDPDANTMGPDGKPLLEQFHHIEAVENKCNGFESGQLAKDRAFLMEHPNATLTYNTQTVLTPEQAAELQALKEHYKGRFQYNMPPYQ